MRSILVAMMMATILVWSGNVMGQTCSECNVGGGCTTDADATGDCSFAACDGSVASGDGAAALSGGNASGLNSVALGGSTASGSGSFAAQSGTASGDGSVALHATAGGDDAFAAGSGIANGTAAIALGVRSWALGTNSVTMGRLIEVTSTTSNSIAIGNGFNSANLLSNSITNSIMFGMNSNVSTMFIEDAGGTTGSIGRVGVGNITAPASLLHVRDEVRVGLASSDNGSIVFNNSTNANTLSIKTGVTSATHSWILPTAQGANGEVLTNNGSGVLSWTEVSTDDAWLLAGNADTSATTDFLGTTDNVDLVFRTNNTEKVRVLTNGNVGVGTTTPDGLLHLLDEDGTNTDLIIERGLGSDNGRLVFQDEGGTERGYLSYSSGEDLILNNLDEDEDILFIVRDGAVARTLLKLKAADAQVGINTNPVAALDVEAVAITGNEGLARFTTTDASNNDNISIANASAVNGEFAGLISGFSSDTDEPALTLRAYTWDDTGTEPVFVFIARDANAITNRPLFNWRNNDVSQMLMDANGDLGIGTTTPSGRLDVNGTLFANLGTSGTGSQLRYDNTTGEISEFTSTLNHKTQIEDIQFDKEAFLNLRPVDYQWKESFGGKNDVGLIAEEVQQLMPNMVIYSYKHTYADEVTGEMLRDSIGNPVVDTTQMQPWGVDYHKIPIYLLALVKEQDSLINEMSGRLGNLESIVQNCCSAEPAYRMGSTEQDDITEVKELRLRVYPNPNDGNFTIDYKLDDGQTGKLFLITVSGEKILLSNGVRSMGKENFNISGPSGVYQVVLENSRGEMLKNVKVVITR